VQLKLQKDRTECCARPKQHRHSGGSGSGLEPKLLSPVSALHMLVGQIHCPALIVCSIVVSQGPLGTAAVHVLLSCVLPMQYAQHQWCPMLCISLTDSQASLAVDGLMLVTLSWTLMTCSLALSHCLVWGLDWREVRSARHEFTVSKCQ
jgi:hypothetical protein